jgi:SAM-dependent methyltransferase
VTLPGDQALERFIAEKPANVLEIGPGAGIHTGIMRDAGIKVTTAGLEPGVNVPGLYEEIRPPEGWSPSSRPLVGGPFDGVWCSHVLEHVRNVGQFLDFIRLDLAEGGLLALTVPPARNKLVGGHINQFTEGSLVYNLILAGFDCSQARVGVYGYNISVLVRKSRIDLPPGLKMDKGDLEKLAQWFPWPVDQGDDGRKGGVLW